jgi:hypothetical protein
MRGELLLLGLSETDVVTKPARIEDILCKAPAKADPSTLICADRSSSTQARFVRVACIMLLGFGLRLTYDPT